MRIFISFLIGVLLTLVTSAFAFFWAQRNQIEFRFSWPSSPERVSESSMTSTSDEAGTYAAIPDESAIPAPTRLEFLSGHLRQGGFLRGKAENLSAVLMNGETIPTLKDGGFFIGFDRDQAEAFELQMLSDVSETEISLKVAARDYVRGQVIEGLELDMISNARMGPLGHDDFLPTDEQIAADVANSSSLELSQVEQQRQIQTTKTERQQKDEALASRAEADGILQDWLLPMDPGFRISSQWGAGRVIRGENKIHYGLDMAAPTGTELRAPANGVITLAATGFYYDGGIVMIDHGLGLTSIYLHMSEVDVQKGDRVSAGQRLGAVGATGRATGPHLCWRLYWNSGAVKLDPAGLVKHEN
ncbi:MAG: hypothetical protein CMK09_11080 [Ponticaulis sp.]|nr:hypothetical protein [Ponticaulis sp.]|tara:strand:- start:51679 stop:52755 length:1077 start_codon:yes stop_codon:yes gene_type:complete